MSGKDGDDVVEQQKNIGNWILGLMSAAVSIASACVDYTARTIALSGFLFMEAWFGFIQPATKSQTNYAERAIAGSLGIVGAALVASSFDPGLELAENTSPGAKAVAVAAAYGGNIAMFMFAENIEETGSP